MIQAASLSIHDPSTRVGTVVSARTNSTRLPGKALLPLGGVPMVSFLLARLSKARRPDELILATTTLKSDDALASVGDEMGIKVFRGSPTNLIERHLGIGEAFGLDYLVRITGDCPFVDGNVLDDCLAQAGSNGMFDLATTKGQFPVGIDVEIFPHRALREIAQKSDLDDNDREHLTLYFYRHQEAFQITPLNPPKEWVDISTSFTVDTKDDYERVTNLVSSFSGTDFSVTDLVRRAKS